MKKIITLVFVVLCSICYGQEQTAKKFQLGISYSLTNEDEIFKNPFNVYANYQIKKWDNLNLNAGLKVFYFGSQVSANFTNKLGFNPNISTSYFFAKNKLNGNFALGYYFDSFEFKPTTSGLLTNPKREFKTNGFTIAPGLKYYFHSNFFIDANLTLLIAKEKDDIGGSNSSNNTLFNIGIGVAF